MITDTVTLYCFARYRPNGPLSGYSYAETTDTDTAASLRAWAQYEEIAVDWTVEIPRGSWPPVTTTAPECNTTPWKPDDYP